VIAGQLVLKTVGGGPRHRRVIKLGDRDGQFRAMIGDG
jgi:hypothetical protein